MADVNIAILDEASDGDVVTISVAAHGLDVMIMGEPREKGRTLFVDGVHIGLN
jgi:hypothetical protein